MKFDSELFYFLARVVFWRFLQKLRHQISRNTSKAKDRPPHASGARKLRSSFQDLFLGRGGRGGGGGGPVGKVVCDRAGLRVPIRKNGEVPKEIAEQGEESELEFFRGRRILAHRRGGPPLFDLAVVVVVVVLRSVYEPAV